MDWIHTAGWLSWLIAFLVLAYAVERYGSSPWRHFGTLAVFALAAIGYVATVWVLGSTLTTLTGAAATLALLAATLILHRRKVQ